MNPPDVSTVTLSATSGQISITGLFLIGRTLLGLPGALTVAALTLTFPMVGMLSSWMSAYPLWATAAIWAVVGIVLPFMVPRGPHKSVIQVNINF